MLGVGARFQARGHKPWGRKAAKRAYKLAFLPQRPQRLPPLRAFHLSASRNQLTHAEILNFELYTLFGIVSEKLVEHSVLLCPPKLLYYKKNVIWGMKHELGLHV